MRIALLVHGLPPHDRTGVETHVAALAAALARAGAEVLVLARRRDPNLPHLAERREQRDGYRVDWLNLVEPPRDVRELASPPGVAGAVGQWLDRERPDLVHVHHVQGFGWSVLDEVAERGLALVFTAHDYHAVCHRTTLLRPDLSRCGTPGDAELCARCDRASASLHGRAELGDWHMGVPPEELDAGLREELSRVLTETAPSEALEARREADRLRARSLERIDLVLSPTRLVARRLAEGGIPRERIRLMPYALPCADLRRLPARTPDPSSALRVGFLGGMTKHKGAHVLLAAGAGMSGLELHLHGDSSDRPYVERVRRRSERIGAHWHGAFGSEDLASILGELDLVAVPSLWDENAPFVIREAFAAGRPVLASDVGALPESVRDGVDGLLIAPGDVDAWRAALAGLVHDRERVRRLGAGIEAPPELDGAARELLGHYARCAQGAAPRRRVVGLPAHVRAFQTRREGLSSVPLDELHARVRAGLRELRRGLGLGPSEGLRDAPNSELVSARELLRDARREAAWSRSVAGDDARARVELAAERDWLRTTLEQQERVSNAAHEAERDWLRESVARLEEERDWLRASLEGLEREQELLTRDREALGAAHEAEREEHLALQGHERWLRSELELLAGLVEEQAEAQGANVDRLLARTRERVQELARELEWRRQEMAAALGEGGALTRAFLARMALGRRLSAWQGKGEGEER